MELNIKSDAQFKSAIVKAGDSAAKMKAQYHDLFMYSINKAIVDKDYNYMGVFLKTMSNGSGKELMIAHIKNFTDVKIKMDNEVITGTAKNSTFEYPKELFNMSDDELLTWYNDNPYYTTMKEEVVKPVKTLEFFTEFSKLSKKLKDAKNKGLFNQNNEELFAKFLELANDIDEFTAAGNKKPA